MKTLLSLLLLVFLFSQAIFADSEGAPSSYTVVTADRKHIFVDLVPSDAAAGLVESGVTYHQSGMYLNDGSTTPLWTVDWYGRIYLPNGGEYVIRRGGWARYSGSYREEALTFIAHGEVLKTYAARDLVDFPWLLPHTVSHYVWEDNCFNQGYEDDVVLKAYGTEFPNNAAARFTADGKQVVVASALGDRLSFDLASGNVISASHPSRYVSLGIFSLLFFAYLIFRYRSSAGAAQTGIIREANLLFGIAFTLAILIVPAISVRAVQSATDCTNYLPSLVEYLHISLFLLPAWVAGHFGAGVGEPFTLFIHSSGVLLPVSLAWVSSVLLFSFVDRICVYIFSRSRTRS